MPQIGPAEILVILVVGLLVFGPTRLPEMGRQVGHAMRQVKSFQAAVMDEVNGVIKLHDGEETEATAETAASGSGG
jgi:Tat protein translocase TatB subunit